MWMQFGGKANTLNHSPCTAFRLYADTILNDGNIIVSLTVHQTETVMKAWQTTNGFRNDGVICARNTALVLLNGVTGVGCIVVGAHSSLQVNGATFSNEQTIYMNPGDGIATVYFNDGNGLLYTFLSIRGFRKNTFLDFKIDITRWSYHGGNFYFSAGGKDHVVSLGPGYLDENFVISQGTVTYDGEMDAETPPLCLCEHDFHRALGPIPVRANSVINH